MGKKKTIIVVLSIVLAIFFIYQIYASLYNPISTEIAVQHSFVEGVDITGYFIRNEEFVKSNNDGALHFEIEDGERIASGGIIANVFATQNQSVAASRMVKIEKEIANMENIQKYNDLNAVDITLINSKIYNNLNILASTTQTGKYGKVGDAKEEMLTLISRRQLAMGQTVDFSAQISALQNEYNTLQSVKGSPIGTVKSNKSGYFLSSVDGYETVLTPEILDTLTPEVLSNISPKENSEAGIIGKLVYDYKWYIAANVPITDSVKFKVGDNLVVSTNVKSNPELNVTVEKINMSIDSDTAVIVLSCQEMNAELSSLRSANMKIVLNTYKGLKVSSSALRVVSKEDGTNSTGVYVLSGMTAHFVPVNIVYSNDVYAICEIEQEDGKLRLYDEIIVKGKNIYDGKIVD